MSGVIRVHSWNDAPSALEVALTSSGGSWPTEDYLGVLIAWDDPREEDWHRARFLNYKLVGTSAGSTDFGTFFSIITFTTGAGDNDIVTLSWVPPRILPHHYTFYIKSGAAISSNPAGNLAGIASFTKIRPSSGTTQQLEIPGWATSAVFANATAVTETRIALVRATSTNAYYDVEGAHGISFFNGAGYIPYTNGTPDTTSGDPLGLFAGNEERTRVIEASTRASQTYLAYTHGPICLKQATGISIQPVYLNPVTGFDLEPRERTGLAANGNAVPLSYVGGGDYGRVLIEVTHGGLSIDAAGYYGSVATDSATALKILEKYMELEIPAALFYSPASTEKYSGAVYYGYIESINERAYTAVQANQRIVIEFRVCGVEYETSQHSNYALVAANLSSQYFDIAGDKRSEFIAGTRFEVRGSTAFSEAMAMADAVLEKFGIDTGGDHSAKFTKGTIFQITGSTAGVHDGTWQCSADATYSAPRTTIYVTGDVTSNVPSGNISISNDGLYVVESAAMSSSNTRITVSTGIQATDASADGYLRIWDQP